MAKLGAYGLNSDQSGTDGIRYIKAKFCIVNNWRHDKKKGGKMNASQRVTPLLLRSAQSRTNLHRVKVRSKLSQSGVRHK